IRRVISNQTAEGSAMHLLKRVLNHVAIAPAEPGNQREILLPRLFRRLQYPTNARRIGGDRLFAEDMLIGVDAGGKMGRSKSWRSRKNDDIDAAIDHLFIGVEAQELARRLDLHSRLNIRMSFQGLKRFINLLLIDVGNGGQLGVIVGMKGLGCRTGSTTATAH